MRNRITIYEPDIINNQKINAFVSLRSSSTLLNENNPVYKILTAEGHEDFFNYIKALGLSNDKNLVLLSSVHHYYYDAEEMKNVKTVINLKEINQIKQIKSFLHSIIHILPNKSNFIGCFVDNEKINGYELRNSSYLYQNKKSLEAIENDIVSRNPFLNMVYSIMDSKTNKYMSRSSVSLLLEDHGFKVKDMTEINGLTYFHSQKVWTNLN
ncbi:MAG: hypothetical protein WCS03_03660 [Bacteroidota bacterium]